MANLQSTTTSTYELIATEVYSPGSGVTPWHMIYMCPSVTTTDWIHIRTPLPATNQSGGSGWNPSIVEVKGSHSYLGEFTYDFQAVINSSGDAANNWYGSQIRINRGNTGGTQNPSGTLPVIYKSTSPYNSYERVCIALPRTTCCCNGWSWVRWWNNTGILDTVAWATVGSTSSANAY